MELVHSPRPSRRSKKHRTNRQVNGSHQNIENMQLTPLKQQHQDLVQVKNLFRGKAFYTSIEEVEGEKKGKVVPFQQLDRIITQMGGQLRQRITSSVNYIITNRRKGDFFAKAHTYNIPTISFRWVAACFNSKQVLPYDNQIIKEIVPPPPPKISTLQKRSYQLLLQNTLDYFSEQKIAYQESVKPKNIFHIGKILSKTTTQKFQILKPREYELSPMEQKPKRIGKSERHRKSLLKGSKNQNDSDNLTQDQTQQIKWEKSLRELQESPKKSGNIELDLNPDFLRRIQERMKKQKPEQETMIGIAQDGLETKNQKEEQTQDNDTGNQEESPMSILKNTNSQQSLKKTSLMGAGTLFAQFSKTKQSTRTNKKNSEIFRDTDCQDCQPIHLFTYQSSSQKDENSLFGVSNHKPLEPSNKIVVYQQTIMETNQKIKLSEVQQDGGEQLGTASFKKNKIDKKDMKNDILNHPYKGTQQLLRIGRVNESQEYYKQTKQVKVQLFSTSLKIRRKIQQISEQKQRESQNLQLCQPSTPNKECFYIIDQKSQIDHIQAALSEYKAIVKEGFLDKIHKTDTRKHQCQKLLSKQFYSEFELKIQLNDIIVRKKRIVVLQTANEGILQWVVKELGGICIQRKDYSPQSDYDIIITEKRNQLRAFNGRTYSQFEFLSKLIKSK